MSIDLSFGGSAFPRAAEVRQKLYAAASVGQSARFRRLDRYDAFYRCLEYAHQAKNWQGLNSDDYESISPEVILPRGFVQPLGDKSSILDKRPTAPLRLAPMIVDRFTALLFAKSRVPKVTVAGDDDATAFLQAVFQRAGFWRTMTLARTYGGSMGSTLITVHLRRGRFSYTAHSPKMVAEVIWDDADLRIPAGVLIQYLFLKETEVFDSKTGRPTGQLRSVPHVYRRIIDEEWDTVYVPEPVEGGQMPGLMRVDDHQSYRHALGKFPGAYVQNLPCDDELDGIPDCDGAYQMIETIDRQIAQSNKGLLANQDPTVVYGRDKKMDQAGIDLHKGSENAMNVGIGGFASYLEMSGSGIAAAQAFVSTLRQAVMDKTACVSVDPEKLSGAASSGYAIELMYQPTLDKADRLRLQYGEAVERVADATLSMARAWTDPSRYRENVRNVVFDVPPLVVEELNDPDDPSAGKVTRLLPRNPGVGGFVSLEWGPYFSETPQDVQTKVTLLATAFTSGMLDSETSVRRTCAAMGIDDVEGVLARVRAEQEAKLAQLGAYAGLEGEPVEGEDGEIRPVDAPEAVPVAESVFKSAAVVYAAQEVIGAFSRGEVDRESALGQLQIMFQLTRSQAEMVLPGEPVAAAREDEKAAAEVPPEG